MIVVSFDIDGTLEVGSPAGPIGLDVVRRVLARGYVVGSASDRGVADQRALFASHGITLHFIGHKHTLDAVRERHPDARRFIYVGDTDVDRHYATLHGFEFYLPEDWPEDGAAGWIL